MSNCLFCRIVAGEIPSTKVYEDDTVLAFRDIAPQAPTHILVIPKAHIASVAEVNGDNSAVVAHIFEVIAKVAEAEGLTNGYRVVSNCGDHAGQTVHHLHFHILGGRQLNLEMAECPTGKENTFPVFCICSKDECRRIIHNFIIIC